MIFLLTVKKFTFYKIKIITAADNYGLKNGPWILSISFLHKIVIS